MKKIWQAETKKDAIELKDAFVEKYAEKFDKAIECLEVRSVYSQVQNLI